MTQTDYEAVRSRLRELSNQLQGIHRLLAESERNEPAESRFAEARDSAPDRDGYKANFLWPHKEKSVEEAGYEFANARTEGYRKIVWGVLLERIKAQNDQAHAPRI